MILKALREGLGRLIVLGNFITRPKPVSRSAEVQQAVDEEVKNLSIYQFFACPFCVKVRRALHRLNLPIELRDAQNDQQHRSTLLAEGGVIKVPCLRIGEGEETQWMYESSDIIAYLEKRFPAA